MNLDPRLLRLARESRITLFLTISLGLAAGIFTVLQAGILSYVMGAVFLGGQDLAQVSTLLWGLMGVIILRAGLACVSELSANASAVRIKTGLQSQLFEHLLQLGPAFAGGERTGELTNTAVEGIEALDAYFSQYLPQLALSALVPLTFLLFVFPLDPLSGMVLLLTAPLIPIFMILIGNLAQALTRRQWQTLSRVSAYFLDVLQGLTTLKILGRSQAQIKVIEQVSERFRETTMGVLRVTFLSALVLEMVATLSTAVVAVEVGLRLLYGRLTFQQAFFVLLLAPEFYLPLRLLGTRFHAGMAGVSAAKRIFEILEKPASAAGKLAFNDDLPAKPATRTPQPQPDPVFEKRSAAPTGPMDEDRQAAAPAVRFENVYYTYPDGREALNGVSFALHAGQKVALVGPSGAGKSTVASLLLCFLEPQAGQILVDGQPLAALDPQHWLEQVAWVPQRPYLFQDSIAANIRLARPEATQQDVLQAARQAHADEFIQDLPQGYETLVGERGANLSGGQAQRIALARAFLKNAPFILFDEATANLDPALEAQLSEAIERLLAGRTALIIAHRLPTVMHADQILVLDQGLVVEHGTHRELMQQAGLYRNLVDAYGGEVEGTKRRLESARGFKPNPSPASEIAQVFNVTAAQGLPGEVKPEIAPRAPTRFARSTFWRLVSLVRPFKGLVVLSTLMGFATIGSAIGLMATSAYLISAAALHPSIADLQVAIVGVRFFGITRGLFRYLERYLSHEVTFRLLARLRVKFYQALEPLAPARLMRYHSGDLLARIISDIGSLENFYVRVLAPPFVAVLVGGGMLIFLGSFSPALAAAWLACFLAAGVAVPFMIRTFSRGLGREMINRRALLNSQLVDGLQGMPELQAFGQGQRQAQRIAALSQDLGRFQMKMARLSGLQTGLETFLANLALWLVLTLAIPLVFNGQIQGVFLAVVVLAAIASFEAVQTLPTAAQNLESSLEAARRLFDIVDAQPEIKNPKEPLPFPENFGLEVKNLKFEYSPASPKRPSPETRIKPDGIASFTINNLSFSLPPGKRLAVVGPSGAGKSTLVNLLLRFWDYQEGEILLNGNDLHRYRQEDVRHAIAVVAQDTYLFHATVRENLLIARPKAGEEEMIRAAQSAQIHDFISALPQGYDTWVGEQGLRLSGGERQRLSIARALLKDARFLVLDEATANLDALTERQVLDAILCLMEGRTTLMITHRLIGLEGVDEILVLDKGRVVEQGTHLGLLKKDGLYQRMWELQKQVLETEAVQVLLEISP